MACRTWSVAMPSLCSSSRIWPASASSPSLVTRCVRMPRRAKAVSELALFPPPCAYAQTCRLSRD